MTNANQDKPVKDVQLEQSFNKFIDLLDTMDPKETDIKEIDEMIALLEDIETKFRQSPSENH